LDLNQRPPGYEEYGRKNSNPLTARTLQRKKNRNTA
jgi:hypothetical protein